MGPDLSPALVLPGTSADSGAPLFLPRPLPLWAQSYPGVKSLPEEPPQLLRVALGPASLRTVQDGRLHALGHHCAHE